MDAKELVEEKKSNVEIAMAELANIKLNFETLKLNS